MMSMPVVKARLARVPSFVEEGIRKAPNWQIRRAVKEILIEIKSDELTFEKVQHLLFIGISASGKTSLAGFLASGGKESGKGHSGPKQGTKQLETTTMSYDNQIYSVHDTRGLQAGSCDEVLLKEIKQELKEIYEHKKCLVVVCISWSNRLDNNVLSLKICNLLGNDVWNNTIIAITHCDVLPPSYDSKDQHEKARYIEHTKQEWEMGIKEKLSKLNVSDNVVNNICICFTSHTSISKSCEVEPEWKQKLNDALIATGKLDKSFANMNRPANTILVSSIKAEQHLLFIGRRGTGKSSLAKWLINSGELPFGQNTSCTGVIKTTTYKKGDTTYYVYNTTSLEDKHQIKQIYDKFNCLVVVCFRWNCQSFASQQPLEVTVCNSLGDNVWSQAIIAITHCDILPPDVSDKHRYIEETKQSWQKSIQMQIHDQDVAQKICFTATSSKNVLAEPKWIEKLYQALIATGRAGQILHEFPHMAPAAEPQHKALEAKHDETNLKGRDPMQLANGAHIFIKNKYKKFAGESNLKFKLEELSLMTEDGYTCTIGPALCADLEKNDLTVAAVSILIWLHL